MSLTCIVPPVVSHAQSKALRRQERAQQKHEKALKKHEQRLQKPEIRQALEKTAESPKHRAEQEVVLSDHFPLDQCLARRAERKPPIKFNPFVNVKCSTAESNLKSIGLTLGSTHSGSSHHAVSTLPQEGHSSGYRVGLIAKHNGKTIPEGTHRAMVGNLNKGFITLLNHADETVSKQCAQQKLSPESQEAFRLFVAETLAQGGAKNRDEIIPHDLLSTQDHAKIKALRALVEKANPDTVIGVWAKAVH